MNGLHLIGDLNGCRCDPRLLLDGQDFESRCVAMVEAAGLTIMDVRFHQFEGSGFTGTVVLAESHLAIHTWPERAGLTLDVYVCNFSADNSAKARALFRSLIDYFQPTELASHEIDRGDHTLNEPLNASTGFSTTLMRSRMMLAKLLCLMSCAKPLSARKAATPPPAAT